MDSADVDVALTAAEQALDSGDIVDLGRVGFWSAVAAAKRDATLRSRFSDRIATIDRTAFERWALFSVGVRTGTWLMVLGTVGGLVIIGAAYSASEPWNGLALLAGTSVLLVTTHGLAHLVTGAAAGIRFSHWFVGSLLRPQPGVKLDYGTYLAAPAAARARMHASGAVVTKAMPFLMLGAAWGMEAPAWAWIALVAIGVASIVTDVLWSVGSSDWKRYRRERRFVDAETA